MTDKLIFSVDNVEVIKENVGSNFAVLNVDFFASGENLHDTYISEETLMKTANGIKNVPLVWRYDKNLDDIYTHADDETPCGFVPETSEVKSRILPDGRTMLSVVAYVWKRYTGEILKFFKRDGGKKPVSVEISVFDSKPLSNGLKQILDFKYECITILGSFVTPAIPLANASVLSFADIKKEYSKALEEEFPVLIKIPDKVKENVKQGLDLRKKHNKGGTSIGLVSAQYLMKNASIPLNKLREIKNNFPNRQSFSVQDTSPPSEDYINSLLWGGNEGLLWIEETLVEFDNDKSNLLTFPYKSTSEMNPALKGITPPITVSQANEIARQADAIGADKGGWGIAIKHFKDSHRVENGKWVKKNLEKMENDMKIMKRMADGSEAEVEEKMAVDTPEEEKVETPAKEKAETPAEEKKEEEKGVEKKFEFPANFNWEKMSALFADDNEEDEMCKMAKAELEKREFCDPGIMMGGMYAKMCKMAEAMCKMAEDSKVYMAENEELKKFKAEVEMAQKTFAVEATLKELSEKVIIPSDAKEEMLAEAEKYSFANLETWKMYCKAKSFDFAVKEVGKSDVVRVGLPFGATTQKKQDDLWS